MTDFFPNFKKDGRLFPLWILQNFKKYKLDPLILTDDDCNIKKNEYNNKNVLELRKYQEFVGSFLDYRSPYRNILLYHGIGSGKTAAAINIYNMLYNYNPDWNVFILVPSTLKNEWLGEIKKWINKPDKEGRKKNIEFISYNSPVSDKQFLDLVNSSDSNKKNLFIIDEVHNFISRVYTNIKEKKGKNALTIYDYIKKDKDNNGDTRVVLISGTPIQNYSYELVLLFNLLRQDIFPTNISEFEELYIKSGKYSYINPNTKNMFQRRILGLVSYYKLPEGTSVAKEKIKIKKVPMSKYQEEIYSHFELIENELKKKNIKLSTNSSNTYSIFTRHACNFVFPFINKKINGENRPRGNNINLNDEILDKYFDGKKEIILNKIEKTYNKKIMNSKMKKIILFEKEINEYIKNLVIYLDKINENDKLKKNTIYDDIEVYKNKYKMKFNKFWKNYNNKSNLLTELYNLSCKMTCCLFNIIKSKGLIIFYSSFVKMEGIEIFKLYLKYIGYTNYNDKKNKGIDFYRYIEYHGNIDTDQKLANKTIFNDNENLYGKNVKIIIISPSVSVGISFFNVRQIHILEPYWHETRIKQIIGRGNRNCSHKLLPIDERNIEIFRYLCTYQNKEKLTTDEIIYNKSTNKQYLIDSFLNILKEVSVDCNLFKEHTMYDKKYKCFQFNESSYFDNNIGPSYKHNVYLDKKINDGLYSINSEVKKIKVIKINAVKKYENNKYSSSKVYWYNNTTGVVYDYELDYPIGKISLINNIPNKLDKDTYIIDELIKIPEINVQ